MAYIDTQETNAKMKWLFVQTSSHELSLHDLIKVEVYDVSPKNSGRS